MPALAGEVRLASHPEPADRLVRRHWHCTSDAGRRASWGADRGRGEVARVGATGLVIGEGADP